ncbi:tetratricopeptide repeat protein [Laspinema olomoucense]|uniref:tetratricopeptide repeat protein n=1 Tax=Laspinema olomoucense TaxID=3231600 RepID=UPI0021BAE06A|nr:tetratricopeptide repeat protein [Laspinema sp. D3a]MCT7992025.1 tetratricopeptide repeat protein [Laspinema sp. D3a]
MSSQLDVLLADAFKLYESGSFTRAEQKFCQVLEMDLTHPQALCGLGMVYYRQGLYEDALDYLEQSLEFDANQAICHYTQGLVLAKLGYLAEAATAYQQAIAIDPSYLNAYSELGNVCIERGDLTQAETAYRQRIALSPDFSSYVSLGHLFIAQQRIDEAISAYQPALELQPRNPDILYSLGIAFTEKNHPDSNLYLGFAAYRRQEYESAISHYQNFQKTRPGEIDLYLALADCYQQLNRWEEAIIAYRQGIALHREAVELYLSFILALQNCGQVEEARQIADEGLAVLPDRLSLKLEKIRLFPVLYQNSEQVDFYRNRFTLELDNLIQNCPLKTALSQNRALNATGVNTNFYLQYQGKNDLELQQKYGQFVHQVMAANYPQWVKTLAMPTLQTRERIRIGYISACLQWHTVGMVFSGWLEHRNREEFEVYCYDVGRQRDRLTDWFRIHSDYFYSIPDDIPAVCQQIQLDSLHILVFLDIGMYAPMTQLAGLRLAPVQCVAWGHPITSGLPTQDYFISSDLMEPENAQTHYSEQLIRLPNLGIYFPKPQIPEVNKNRADYGIPDDAVMYLSCQSLFKYLPQYDIVFSRICQGVAKAKLVFIGHKSNPITAQFCQRLDAAFAQVGLDYQEFCIILPRQSKRDYWNLLSLADIGLDTCEFTGFLTTLEAVAVNLPIVTHLGLFMRGRQSAGILRRVGATETVAQTQEDYIKIAVTLGLNREWREAIATQMNQGHQWLYEDTTGVKALEDFYRAIVKEKA